MGRGPYSNLVKLQETERYKYLHIRILPPPHEIESKHRILYPIIREARNQSLKIYIKEDKLCIEGKYYSADALRDMPPSLDPQKIATPTRNGVTPFYLASSPLSNYFPTTIKDPIVYKNSEQGYHHKCAEHFNDDISSTEILKAATPNDAHKIRNSIKGRNKSTWLTDETLAKNTMYRVCKMKFEQNLDLRHFLINTGTTN